MKTMLCAIAAITFACFEAGCAAPRQLGGTPDTRAVRFDTQYKSYVLSFGVAPGTNVFFVRRTQPDLGISVLLVPPEACRDDLTCFADYTCEIAGHDLVIDGEIARCAAPVEFVAVKRQ